jgi:hypothetical protein
LKLVPRTSPLVKSLLALSIFTTDARFQARTFNPSETSHALSNGQNTSAFNDRKLSSRNA